MLVQYIDFFYNHSNNIKLKVYIKHEINKILVQHNIICEI